MGRNPDKQRLSYDLLISRRSYLDNKDVKKADKVNHSVTLKRYASISQLAKLSNAKSFKNELCITDKDGNAIDLSDKPPVNTGTFQEM